jgi:hypothetical protein
MRVRADQTDAAEAARDQTADEREPGRSVLGRDDIEAERLAEAILVDADRVHDADVDRAATLPALDHERVQGQVRERRAIQRPGAEVLDDLGEPCSSASRSASSRLAAAQVFPVSPGL